MCIIGRNYINLFDIMGLIAILFYIISIISLIILFSSFSLYNNNNIKPFLYSNIPTATAGHSLGPIAAPYFYSNYSNVKVI